MAVLKREQSVDCLLYTGEAGICQAEVRTSPAEAGMHVTSQASSALWRANNEGSIFGSSVLCSSRMHFTADALTIYLK